jgi:hypothetical protein
LDELESNGENTDEITARMDEADRLAAEGRNSESAMVKESAFDKLRARLASSRLAKLSFVWWLVLIGIVAVGGYALYYSMQLQKEEEKQKDEAGKKLTDMKQSLIDKTMEEKSGPDFKEADLKKIDPIKITLKEKKFDAE